MAIRIPNYQPVKLSPTRHSVAGFLAVAAVRGLIVSRHATTPDTLELATGKSGWPLRRNVVSAADKRTFMEQDALYPEAGGFEAPSVVGASVQAEEVVEYWVEGPDLLHTSMDASVAARAAVTTNAGKIALLTDAKTQEIHGFVEQNVAAINTAAPARRFLIKVAPSAKLTIV